MLWLAISRRQFILTLQSGNDISRLSDARYDHHIPKLKSRLVSATLPPQGLKFIASSIVTFASFYLYHHLPRLPCRNTSLPHFRDISRESTMLDDDCGRMFSYVRSHALEKLWSSHSSISRLLAPDINLLFIERFCYHWYIVSRLLLLSSFYTYQSASQTFQWNDAAELVKLLRRQYSTSGAFITTYTPFPLRQNYQWECEYKRWQIDIYCYFAHADFANTKLIYISICFACVPAHAIILIWKALNTCAFYALSATPYRCWRAFSPLKSRELFRLSFAARKQAIEVIKQKASISYF